MHLVARSALLATGRSPSLVDHRFVARLSLVGLVLPLLSHTSISSLRSRHSSWTVSWSLPCTCAAAQCRQPTPSIPAALCTLRLYQVVSPTCFLPLPSSLALADPTPKMLCFVFQVKWCWIGRARTHAVSPGALNELSVGEYKKAPVACASPRSLSCPSSFSQTLPSEPSPLSALQDLNSLHSPPWVRPTQAHLAR